MSTIRGKGAICAAFAVAVLLGGACSGGGGNVTSGSDAGAGADTSRGGGGGGCTTNAECASKVPPTKPANCAEGTCNTLQGTCVFSAKDEDGDGHPAFDCKSTNGVAVVAGDDCNDHDANLYPGHSESCKTLADGGAAGSNYCAPGKMSCNADGTQTACENTTVCSNSACVNEKCVGTCTPGVEQCDGNSGVQTCTSTGMWSAPVACTGTACISKGTTASCQGSCSPGSAACSGTQPETCVGGMWTNNGAACSGSTPVCDDSDGTCVTCAANALGCAGAQPQHERRHMS
jgi:hypothetical protein